MQCNVINLFLSAVCFIEAMAKNPFEFKTHEIGVTAEEFYTMVHKIPDFSEDSAFEDFEFSHGLDEEMISHLGKGSESESSTNQKYEAEISIGTNSRDCDDSKESNPADSILKLMKSIINPFLKADRKIKSHVKQQDVVSDDVISSSETTENDEKQKIKSENEQQEVVIDDVISIPETTENDENLKIKSEVQQQDVVIDEVISSPEATKNDEQNHSVDEKFELSSSVNETSKQNYSLQFESNSSDEGNSQDVNNNKYYYLQKEQPYINGYLHDSKSDSVVEEPTFYGETDKPAPNRYVMEVYETSSDFQPNIEVKEGSESEPDVPNHDFSQLKTETEKVFETDGKAGTDSLPIYFAPENYEHTKMNDNEKILKGKEYNDCHKSKLDSYQKKAISEYNFPNVPAGTPSQFKTNDKVIEDSFPIRYVPENYEATKMTDNEKILTGKEYDYQNNKFNSDQKTPITEHNFPINPTESPRQEQYLFNTNRKVVEDRLPIYYGPERSEPSQFKTNDKVMEDSFPIRHVPENYEPTRRNNNEKVLIGKEDNDCQKKKFYSDYKTAITGPIDPAELTHQEEYLFKTNRKVVEDRLPIYYGPERSEPTIKNYNEKILLGKENNDYQKNRFDLVSEHNFRNNPAESYNQEEHLPNNSQELYDFAHNLFLARRRKLNRFPEDSENPNMDSLRRRHPVNDGNVVNNVEAFLSGLTSIIE